MTPEDKERAKLTEQIKGVGQKTATKMWETGYRSPEHILYQDDTQAFADAVGVPFKKARQLWYAAKEYLEREEGLTDENFEERKQQPVILIQTERMGQCGAALDRQDACISHSLRFVSILCSQRFRKRQHRWRASLCATSRVHAGCYPGDGRRSHDNYPHGAQQHRQ